MIRLENANDQAFYDEVSGADLYGEIQKYLRPFKSKVIGFVKTDNEEVDTEIVLQNCGYYMHDNGDKFVRYCVDFMNMLATCSGTNLIRKATGVMLMMFMEAKAMIMAEGKFDLEYLPTMETTILTLNMLSKEASQVTKHDMYAFDSMHTVYNQMAKLLYLLLQHKDCSIVQDGKGLLIAGIPVYVHGLNTLPAGLFDTNFVYRPLDKHETL